MENLRILLLGGLLLLTGCGDLFMGKQETKKMSQLLSCDADPSALTHIFTKNIKGELFCLEESLNLFVDIVKTDRPGNLSYKELSAFIGKNMESVDPTVFGPLKGFFEINSLLSGDDPMYIKKQNIKHLMEMLVLINDVMVKNKVFEYFSQDEVVDYQEHSRRKAAIFNAFSGMEQALSRFFKNNDNQLNLVAFIKRFEDVGNLEILRNSESLLFIKRVFLGGSKYVITASELKRLMLMLADASKIAFDVSHLPKVKHSEDEKEAIMESLKEDFETVAKNLYPAALSSEPLMNLDDVFNALQEHFPELANLSEYKQPILQAKRIFLGNNSSNFTAGELRILFNDIILKNLKRGVFFYKAYAANAHILNGTVPLFRDLPYVFANNELEESFKADFNRIAKDYWFFPDMDLIAPYKNKIERSPWGMFIVATLEDLVARTFAHYTDKDPNAYGGYKMNQNQIQAILMDFKDFLRSIGAVLPGREMNAAETINLMSSLFQKQSDGNVNDIEVNETVELLVTMMSGYRLSNRFYEELDRVCGTDWLGRISPICLEENFSLLFELKVDESGKRFGDYLPKLERYMSELDLEVSTSFISNVGVFTRACTVFKDGAPVPVTKGDLFLVITGIINMESTYTRFDRRGDGKGGPDNILGIAELSHAYKEVYRQAIESRVPESLSWRGLDVFHYLLANGEEPGALEMIFRITPAGYPFAAADRFSVASVLKVIAKGSEANLLNPFNCETLR